MTPDDLARETPSPEETPADAARRLLPPGFGVLLVQAQALQMMQIEAWLAWQRGVLAALQEVADQWAARFGGGLPIDA